jgi:hypothetical protein
MNQPDELDSTPKSTCHQDQRAMTPCPHVPVERLRPEIRCQSAGAGSGFMIGLCGSSDSFELIFGLRRRDSARPQLAWWFEQRAAQVLEQAQAV